jgi:hypothetical protein
MRALVLAAVVAASAFGVSAGETSARTITAVPATKSAEFYSPIRPGVIGCDLHDPSGSLGYNVYCQFDPVNSPNTRLIVKMGAAGRLTLCRNRCPIGSLGEGVRSLGFGKQATVGRFRCQSLRTGVKCIVIRSGKGFLISSKGVHPVAP